MGLDRGRSSIRDPGQRISARILRQSSISRQVHHNSIAAGANAGSALCRGLDGSLHVWEPASSRRRVSVGSISTLENLDLRDCGISDAGLAHLSSLSGLKALRMSGKSGACSVSDDGMEHVAKLPNLKVLAVDFLWISEDGLKKITGLKNLVELLMADTTIGSDAAEVLPQFPNLKKLRLAKTQIDGSVVASLAQLKNLEDLDLSECAQLADADIKPLGEMKQLKKLNLWRVNLNK